jgi:DNA-binding XRE family transcriptional regulator
VIILRTEHAAPTLVEPLWSVRGTSADSAWRKLIRTAPAVYAWPVRPSDLLLIAEARAAAANGTGRRAREDARLTQREVASACGVSPKTVAMWETGQRTPFGDPALEYGRLLRQLARRAA